MQYKFFRVAVCVYLSGALATSVAHAEGSTREAGDGVNFGTGNHGVNRVIRTWDHSTNAASTGYTGVKGNVTLSFSMPKNQSGNYEVPVDTGTRDTNVMPILTKPSAYLGGQFTPSLPVIIDGVATQSQVDAGLALEPLTYQLKPAELPTSTRPSAPPGWSIFFYISNVHTTDEFGADFRGNANGRIEISPRVWDPDHSTGWQGMPYRGGLAPISGTMNFSATENGAATFTFSPLGTIVAALPRDRILDDNLNRWYVNGTTHNVAPWADGTRPALVVFDPADYANANVKRVTAMTRVDETSELDGSQATAVWSGCQVRPNGGVFGAWGAADVDQGRTGFDAPRLGDMAYDKRYNGKVVPGVSHPIVESNFAPLDTSDARYAGETVTINLGMIARPAGSAVK
jgi:hypothetical protein